MTDPATAPAGPLITRTTVLGALLLAVLWFAPLGYRDIAHPDEGRYSEISREMAATGDWVTPRLDGLKYFEKPPLQYWATAAAFELFGESEFSARLWTALAGFLTVLTVGFTAGRLWGRQAGEYAALVLASCVGMLALSQIVTLDMSVTLFLTLTLCAFLLAQNRGQTPISPDTPSRSEASPGELGSNPGRAPNPGRRWMLVVWAAMAGAMLSKGLIGPVIPGTTLVLYSLVRKDFTFWKRLEWIRGIALFVALAAPWFVLVSMRNPEFPEFFFIHEHFTRFITTEHHRPGPIYYFVPLLVGGLLPWTSLLPQAVRYAWAPALTYRPENRLLVIWAGFIFVFFSLSGSKLPAYILPLFPAVALVLGQALADAPAGLLRRHAWGMAAFWGLIALATPMLARLASGRTPRELNAAYAIWVAAGALIYAALAAAAAWQSQRERKTAAIALLALGGVLGSQVLIAGYQSYSPVKSAKALVASLAGEITPDTELFTVRDYDQTLPFYLKRTVTVVAFVGELELGENTEPERWIRKVDGPGGFIARWNAAPKAVAFTTPETMQQLAKQGVPMKVLVDDGRRVVIRKP